MSSLAQLETKTMRYVRKMPYVKALIISELQNDVEIYRYINTKDIVFKNEISENFLNGLRGGMNELFTDFKKQFEKLKTSSVPKDEGMDFEDSKPKSGLENYQVSIMYDKYFVRKKEIADNVLMILICDVTHDASTTADDNEVSMEQTSFNLGSVDHLFHDYQECFGQIEETIDEISKQISAM